MATISSTLVGKTAEQRAALKAEALCSSGIKIPVLDCDGYLITITGRSFDPIKKLLVVSFTALDPQGKPVDLSSPYQYYNPPIMVYSGMVANPLYPGTDERGKPRPAQIRGFTEKPLEAVKAMFFDTIRHVRQQKGLP